MGLLITMKVSCCTLISLLFGLQMCHGLDRFLCGYTGEEKSISLVCRNPDIIQIYLVFTRTVNESVDCSDQVPDTKDYRCANYNEKLLHQLRNKCNLKHDCNVMVGHESYKACEDMEADEKVHIHIMYQCRSAMNALTGEEMTKIEVMSPSKQNYTGAQATLVTWNYPKSTPFMPSYCRIILEPDVKLRIDVFDFSYDETEAHAHDYDTVPYVMKIDNNNDSNHVIEGHYSAPLTPVKEIKQSDVKQEHYIRFEGKPSGSILARIWMVLSGLNAKTNTYADVSFYCFPNEGKDKAAELGIETLTSVSNKPILVTEKSLIQDNSQQPAITKETNDESTILSTLISKHIEVTETLKNIPMSEAQSTLRAEDSKVTKMAIEYTNIPKITTHDATSKKPSSETQQATLNMKSDIEDKTTPISQKRVTTTKPGELTFASTTNYIELKTTFPVKQTTLQKDEIQSTENILTTTDIIKLIDQKPTDKTQLNHLKTVPPFIATTLKSNIETKEDSSIQTTNKKILKTTEAKKVTKSSDLLPPTESPNEILTTKTLSTLLKVSQTINNVESRTKLSTPSIGKTKHDKIRADMTTLSAEEVSESKDMKTKTELTQTTPTEVVQVLVLSHQQSNATHITAAIIIACVLLMAATVVIIYVKKVFRNPNAFKFGKLQEDQMVLHFKNSNDNAYDEDITAMSHA